MKKKFESTAELINDPYFQMNVERILRDVKKKRHDRPVPPPGRYYKRDWYDRMYEQGNLNPDYFLSNIEAIWDKKSPLSSEIRKVINFVCGSAIVETLEYYEKQKPNEVKTL